MMEQLNLNPFGMSVSKYDPKAHAIMKAQTVNSMPGGLTGYDCSKCMNRGNIAEPKDDGDIFFRECDCMRIRRCIWEMERSGLKNIIREKTFEAYNDSEPWQKALKSSAMAYAENPTGWLLFCGQSGSGKTHLCTAVCRKRLYAGDVVRYMAWRDKTSELKALALDNEHRAEILQGLKTVQLLYIDDLYKTGRASNGSCNPTSADIGLAFEIINYRCINRLVTIISTEKTVQELVEIDEATGSRIVEMAEGHIFSISRDVKRNYRLRGVVTV